MFVVSACLLGKDCKYNGENNYSAEVENFLSDYDYQTICPECLGGLEIPRSPAEIKNGDGNDVLKGTAKVIDKEGNDVSDEFLAGARKSLKLAFESGAKLAILKAHSPSCGVEKIYDGSFSGELKTGKGVTAEFLQKSGIKVFNENQLGKARELAEKF